MGAGCGGASGCTAGHPGVPPPQGHPVLALARRGAGNTRTAAYPASALFPYISCRGICTHIGVPATGDVCVCNRFCTCA